MLKFKAFAVKEQIAINRAIVQIVSQIPAAAREVSEYALGHGGKRLRPLLTVAVARAFGCDNDRLHEVAACIELVHVATLLHDDVLDKALLRRGQVAAQQIFGLTPAILAGDALLATSSKVIASNRNFAISTAFAEAIYQTANGEIMEIANQGQIFPNLVRYISIISGKTAWMIQTACELGALLAQVSDEDLELVRAYGFNLGMSFQIVDDALDFMPQENTGKPQGGDLREGKFTPPIFFYYDSLTQTAQNDFKEKFKTNSFSELELAEIIAKILEKKFDLKTRELADSYLQEAENNLEKLKEKMANKTYYQALQAAIGFVRNRTL